MMAAMRAGFFVMGAQRLRLCRNRLSHIQRL